MGSKVADLLHFIADALCVVAERFTPPQMADVDVMARATVGGDETVPLPFVAPPMYWHSYLSGGAMDPMRVLAEIEVCDNWRGQTRFRWSCHEHGERQCGPPLVNGADAVDGLLAHLVVCHPNERWPEDIKDQEHNAPT